MNISKAQIQYKLKGQKGHKSQEIDLVFYQGYLQPITTALKAFFESQGLEDVRIKGTRFGFIVRYTKNGKALSGEVLPKIRTY